MKKISLMDVKNALRDARFRETLPESMKSGLIKYLNNPGCGCNTPFYKEIINNCKDQLLSYYPNSTIESLDTVKSDWQVINCHVSELENKLRELSPGKKNITAARFQDQITIIINEVE